MARALVILNPSSGNGAGAKLEPAITAALREGGLDFDLTRTTAPRQAIQIAEQALRNGYERLIAVGGDGTLNETANGLMRSDHRGASGTLGIIPVGSGNDFGKVIGLAPNWKAGVERILAGRTRQVDIGRVAGDQPAPGYDNGPHYFVNGLDTGFGAQVAVHAHEWPFLTGTAMYLAAVFKTLVHYSVPHVRIELGDDLIEQESAMVAVSNGRCYGGGFWVAPTAEADDGLFDVMIAQGLGRVGILTLIPKVMKGTHIGDPRVRFEQATRVVIESPDPLIVEADGELPFLEAHRLEIDILPKRLCLLA